MSVDEEVGLYDEAGNEVGTVPRSRMRAQNLRHGATAVVVRDHLGRVYVHRRTTTKDVYPGLLDFAAGGVLQAGERPPDGAAREAEEELGVHGVPLVDLGQADYADEFSTYRAFRYTACYSGPIRWQPEEVSWGDWFTVDALRLLIEQTPNEVVPDSCELWADQLAAWARHRTELAGGWDSVVTLVEGRWIDRSPRHDQATPGLLVETRLLPAIAARLPLPVPEPVVVHRDPLVVRHRLVTGEACDPASLTLHDGRTLGRFLRALHDLPGSVVTEHGVCAASEDAGQRAGLLAGFRSVVMPHVPPSLVAAATGLLERAASVGEQALCHGDLTREHLLVRDGGLAGVIDWGDTRVSDPAHDLAWALEGTNPRFAEGLTDAYGVTADQARRAAQWFCLIPWHATYRALRRRDDDVDRHLADLTAALRHWSMR